MSPQSTLAADTVSQYLLNCLQKLGVDHIFGVPGDYVLRLDKRIEEHTIRFINTTRESTAGAMADAYGRLRGLGVACITYGVGLNIVNALAQAMAESSPLLVISGAPTRDDYTKGARLHHVLQWGTHNHFDRCCIDTTQLDIFKNVTIGQAVLNNPAQAKEQIDSLLHLCFTKKKPVYLEIPRDLVDAPLPNGLGALPSLTKGRHSDPAALEEALKEASHILSHCLQPFIWAGHEIGRFGLSSPLLQFAERYQIFIATTLLGKGAVNETHPLCFGVYQGKMSRPDVAAYVDNCDCAIMLGVLLTEVNTGIFTDRKNYEWNISATVNGVSIGRHHYADVTIADFLQRLSGLHLAKTFAALRPAPIRLQEPFTPNPEAKITSRRVFEAIQHYLKTEHIVFADVGDCLFGGTDLIVGQQGFHASSHFGALGFAVPGAIGAQIATPNRRVIALVGDGAFQMTGTELSTAIRFHVDPIIIVFNNHGYSTERSLLDGSYNDIQNWNYHEMSRLLNGGKSIKVTTEEEFDRALKTAFTSRGNFFLIEVELEKSDFSPAMHRFENLVKKHT